MRFIIVFFAAFVVWSDVVRAQDLTVATVTRPPFSMIEDGKDTGFSVELWHAIATDLGLSYEFRRADQFGEMLEQTQANAADLAIANISITSAREEAMDFSHPIYASGLQIMVPTNGQSSPLLKALFSAELLLAIAGAFALLLGGGMLMWWFERRSQPYFDKPAAKAVFPAFWWALNLVINGGFEERVPQSFFGRIFGTTLVLSSLFIVSVFVAYITAAMTVDAIQNSVNSVKDLYSKRVGTISGSTASAFLNDRDLSYRGYDDFGDLTRAFEEGMLDAVVFDAPILAYYTNTQGQDSAALVGNVFLPENYGIALPVGSDLKEPINRALLKLRENGAYEQIRRKYFGMSGG